MTDANGHGALDPAAKIADELRALVESYDERADVLWRELDEIEQGRERYALALADLTGEKVRAFKPRKAAAAPKAKSGGARDSHDWHISDAKVDEVFERIKAWMKRTGETEFTATTIANSPEGEGYGNESFRRAAAVLRERELIRLVGPTRGGGKLFALMPGGGE
jgi:hypothetical protein